MPENTSLTVTPEFQHLSLAVSPAKDYGHGIWPVTCARCGKIRFRRTYKVKCSGRIIGSENLCPPCSKAKFFQKRVPLTCPVCGIVRMVRTLTAKHRLSSLCRKCFNQRGAPRIRNGRHLCTTGNGYVILLGMVGHPLARRNQVLEHWLTLYEQHPMGPESVVWFRRNGFTIHHKNGVRNDNRLENLELRAPGKHPNGWTIEEMEEVIKRYRNNSKTDQVTASTITCPPSA